MAYTDVYQLVRNNENLHILGNVKTSKYVYEHFYEDTQTIEAYLNSKHISGDKDSLGRDKPFFNICLGARNIWFRATDLDRKNIIAKSKKASDRIASVLFTAHVNKWMKESNFGQFLNDWGLHLASYNASVTKFVENSSGLHIQVVPWNRLIPDVLNFKANPVIEILEMSQDELRSHPEYDQEIVTQLINGQAVRRTIDRQLKDFKPNYVRLYEVHGELPLSWLTGKDKDKNEYVQQMHVVSFIGGKQDGSFDKYTLYKGREKKNPYYLTQLIPSTDGSISLNGAVKTLFDAQWMTNHTIKNIKDQLDLASKLIFQTNDPAYANQNVLENIEQGQIMVYQQGFNALAQVQNNSHDITALQNFMGQWKELTQQVTNTPNVMSGQASSSQSAYAKEALMAQQATQNFDIMTQNKGLALEEMFREYITPYILKNMGNSKEISLELNSYGIDRIDKQYISVKATEVFNRKAVKAVLEGTELPNLEEEKQNVQKELVDMGSERFIKPSEISDVTWKEIFKDFEADVEYHITDENIDKNNVLQGLNGVFQTIVSMQGRPMTPQEKLVFNKILDNLGTVSPIELDNLPEQQPTQPAMPLGGQQVGAGLINQQPIQNA